VDEPVPVRCARFSFQVDVELTDMHSNIQTRGRTSDLSMFGLRVDALTLLRPGAKVKVRIADRGSEFVALGRVAYSQPDLGMGVVFSDIDPEAQRILVRWLGELSGQIDPRPSQSK
jgi:PilZ domain